MRKVYMVFIGDSITQATHDTAVLGGFVGRFADWALTQPGLQLRCLGLNQVDNHFPASADPQYSESWGGYECFEFQNALANRPDHNKVVTNVPMFGFAATSIYRQWIDFVVDAAGANNINNAEPAATTWAAHLSWLTALRAALDANGHTNTDIVVMGGYLDVNGFATFAAAANAGVAANVYDVFDAAHPTKHLIRLTNWYTLVGLYNATNYDDAIHPNATGYDLIMNGGTGMIATLGPLVLAKANDASMPMGSLTVAAENKQIDHFTNVAAYSPAATHYLHLYSGGTSFTPITSGTSPGYAPASNTNNTTTWPSIVDLGRNVTNGAAFTFPAPTGDWPADVTGWKLTDNATEGAGTILASHTHTAIPVGTTKGAGGSSTGPISYPIGTLILAGPSGRFTTYALSRLMSLMFGAVANTPLTTMYLTYSNGDLQAGGSQVGSRVAMISAPTFGAATNGTALSIASVTLADQATGNFAALYDAATFGNLLATVTRPASVGAIGTLVAGQIALRLAA